MKYPAVWIATEGSFGVTEEPLTGGSFVAVRKGFFDGLRFFDSAGTEWVVEAAVPTRPLGIIDRLLNRRIEMSIRLGAPQHPPLGEVAERLCSCVDRDPDDLYDQFVSHDELKGLFRSAQSFSELIDHVRNLGLTPGDPDSQE